MKRTILTAGLIIGMIGSVSAQSNVEKAKRFRAAKIASSVEKHAKAYLTQTAAQIVAMQALENKSAAQLDELGLRKMIVWGDNNASQIKELGGYLWNNDAAQLDDLGGLFRNAGKFIGKAIGGNAAQVKELGGFVWNDNASQVKELGGFVWNDNASQVKELGGFVWNDNASQVKKLGGFVWNDNVSQVKELGGFNWNTNASQLEELGAFSWNTNASQVKELGGFQWNSGGYSHQHSNWCNH